MNAGCTKCQDGEPCYAIGHEVWVFSQDGKGYYFTAKILGYRKYQVNDEEFWCYSLPTASNTCGKIFWQTCHTIDPFLDQLNDIMEL